MKSENMLISKMKKSSIKVKIVSIIFTIGILLSLLLAFFSPYQSKQMGEQMMKKDAEFISNILADNLSVALQAKDFDGGAALKDILQKINSMNESDMVTVSKVAIFDTDLNFIDGLNSRSNEIFGIEKPTAIVYVDESSSLKIHLPIIETMANQTLGYAEIHFSKQFLNQESINNTTTALIIALIALAVSVFLGNILSKKIVKPIDNLKNAIDKITEEKKLEFEIEISSSKEINELAGSFKTMMSSIQLTQKEMFEKKAEQEKKKDEELIKKINENKNYLEKNVESVLDAMDKFTDGDLTVKLDVEKNDAIGRLFAGFNNTVSTIQEIIRNVRKQVEATVNASSNISSITEEISRGAEDQKNQTEKVKYAIEQMTESINEAAKNAGTAANSSNSAKVSAQNGGKIVSETIEGMNKISGVVNDAAVKVKELGSRSEEIGEIILVIDEIADQTNLLALNAAIEAARAGEQGRGFAVVADEVKKLAEKTTKATKDISNMIKQIQKNTNDAVHSIILGTEEVDKWKNYTQKAGTSLEEIIIASESVSDLINHVAAAGEEQSITAKQINDNVELISEVASNSVGNIRSVADSSENLGNLTKNLQELISRFSFEEDEIETSHKSYSPRIAINNYKKMIR